VGYRGEVDDRRASARRSCQLLAVEHVLAVGQVEAAHGVAALGEAFGDAAADPAAVTCDENAHRERIARPA
jgi:hypothetical protein